MRGHIALRLPLSKTLYVSKKRATNTNLKRKGKGNEQVHCFDKKCAPNRSICRVYFKFSSRRRGHIPLRLPLSKAIQVTGKIQSYWKKGNEQEVYLFSFKKRATNQQNRSIKHLFKIIFTFMIIIVIELCVIKNGDVLGMIATFAPSD